MELEITWGRAVQVWWAYFWRNLLAILAAGVLGALLGVVLGFVLGAAGVHPGVVQRATALLGGVLGLTISIVPVRLILGKDFGEFRLVLLSNASGERSIPPIR